jgi:transcriptional regulator with XRE-family HTH domain
MMNIPLFCRQQQNVHSAGACLRQQSVAMRKPVAERLREWGAAKGLTQAEAARRLGMSAERYGNYVRGEREPDLQVLGLLFDKLGITPEWLFSDDDEVPISALPDLVPDIKGPLTPGILELDGVSYTALSRYDAALSAGPGSLLEAEPQPLGYHLIETQWLAAISRTAPESLSVVQVDGDSMETTFFHGDWVLVDSTQRRVSREGIYASNACRSICGGGW